MRGENLAAGTEEAAKLALDAANDVVLDAEELMSSLRALQAFREVTNSEIGDMAGDVHNPQTASKSISPQTNTLSPKSSSPELSVCSPDPAIHANVLRKLRQKEKRANDSAAKLRRSQRLAAKEEGNFLDMLTKAVKVKAKRFDLSAASASLATALQATGLVDDPDCAASDANKLRAVASLCGVTDAEAEAISDAVVPSPAP
jgi:hypothetical protein